VSGNPPVRPFGILLWWHPQLQIHAKDIKDLELSLCDTQPAQIWGVGSEFLSSPRLDNQVHAPSPVYDACSKSAG
jgi:aspartyl aminopeptidase